MMNIRNIVEAICRSVCRYPLIWLFITFIPSIPAFYGINHLALDTDVVRLLPESSPAAQWARKLKTIVGDGGFFTILVNGEDREKLIKAVHETVAKVEQLEEIGSVNFTYPKDFIDKYRYQLISTNYLEKILDYTLSMKASLNPFTEDILSEEPGDSVLSVKDEDEIKILFSHYSNLTRYHESEDGKVMGIFIRPKANFTNISQLHKILLKLEKISNDTSNEYEVWAGVGGSQIHNLKEYEVIRSDLNRSGLITVIAVVLILIISFRSFVILPVLLYPLGAGLLWSFALVPPILGDLNIITSFLLIVLFGMGIDYSIHLVKRFQLELVNHSPDKALLETYRSTGMSVVTSGMTTGIALLILAASDFRGFSEFGLIGGGTIFIMLLAMLTVMPVAMFLGQKYGFVKSYRQSGQNRREIKVRASLIIAIFLPLCLVFAAFNLQFNYDFNKLKPQIPTSKIFNKHNSEVYKTKYMSPGAIYLAPDLKSLDELLAVIDNEVNKKDSLFQKVTSVRNYAPEIQESVERIKLIESIQEQLGGRWIKKIEDPMIRKWAYDMRGWQLPDDFPQVKTLPESLVKSLVVGEKKEFYVAGIYPNVSRGNGKNAMAFTQEMYDLNTPDAIQGPVGEMPIFAEILWTVLDEGPWTLIFSFGAVFLLILIGFRSFKETAIITLPLIAGLIMTMGVMALTNFKLNFFNVVIFPALIGMGVDSGVHYYRRWKELIMNTGECQKELYNPLTVCTVTTMMGYSGMVFAQHPGLRSMGILACLGLGCIWLTSLVLFPGVLELLRNRGVAGRN